MLNITPKTINLALVRYFIQYLGIDKTNRSFYKQLCNVLGFAPGTISLYKTALSHRSVKEGTDENNERLEYLGDAILSGIVADYLFNRYLQRRKFLTEMRNKMVNRQTLNEIAVKMGLKIAIYNETWLS